MTENAIQVTGRRRTWRIEFLTDLQTDYTFRVWRETVWEKVDGSVLTVIRDQAPIIRKFSELIGVDPSIQPLSEQIAAIANQWDAEEQAKLNSPTPPE